MVKMMYEWSLSVVTSSLFQSKFSGQSPLLGLPTCKLSCPASTSLSEDHPLIGQMEVAALTLLNGTKFLEYLAFWGRWGMSI